ncbi:MAG: outer membrane beta-barrel protein [Pseudomonadota bacterium]
MIWKSIAALGLAVSVVGAASAQQWYVGGSVGFSQQNDSDNSGQTGAFTTGNLGDGSTLDVAEGTDYGWTTEFDGGLALAAEAGLKYANGLRSGIEIAYLQSDVDTHVGVTLGGGSIDGVDAAALAGSADPLGVTVGELVSDGRGEISSTAVFANVYYDFNRDGPLSPYLGAGIGFADVDVEYAPSGVGIIDDGETAFAYQVKVGASYALTEAIEAYGEYAYRASEDIEVSNALFPGTLDIENEANVFAVGLRYTFG